MKIKHFAPFVVLPAGLCLVWYWGHEPASGAHAPVATVQNRASSPHAAKIPTTPGAHQPEAPQAPSIAPMAPPGSEHVVHLAQKRDAPNPSERRQQLQRSRALVESAIGWLSERRAAALSQAHAEDAALLGLRLARLNGRLEELRRDNAPAATGAQKDSATSAQ